MAYRKNALINGYATVKARGVKKLVYTLTAHKVAVKEAGYELPDEKEYNRRMLKEMRDNISKTEDEQVTENEKRFINSIARSRSNVVQLAANNPWEYFVTLTLKRDGLEFSAYDLEEVKKKLLTFFRNYSQRSGAKTNFKYLLIPEMHEDGAWHFHGLLSGINEKDLELNKYGYLDFKPYSKRFGYVSFGRKQRKGQNKCEMGRIRDLNKTATYISKYISKTMFGNIEYQRGMHLYFSSKGLNKDETLIKGTLNATPEFLADNVAFENEFCYKIFSEQPETLTDKVIPLVNRYENGQNIPDMLPKPKLFMQRYGKLARAFGFFLDEFDYLANSAEYKRFMRFLLEYNLFGYKPPTMHSNIVAEIFGFKTMPPKLEETKPPVMPWNVLPEGLQLEYNIYMGDCKLYGRN